MSYAAKSSPQVETNVFEISGSCDALAEFLDVHHRQTEASQKRWPIGGTILFAVAISAAMWAAIYWLTSLL